MAKPQRFFEDLAIGEIAESSEQGVRLDEMLEFARRFDPQDFHADPEAARDSVFGEVIASGIYSAALWRRLDATISGDIAWVCGIAWEDVRWPHPVRAGDRLRARYECLAKRQSRSRPERGVVEMRYTLINQNDETVFTCRSINLVALRTADRPRNGGSAPAPGIVTLGRRRSSGENSRHAVTRGLEGQDRAAPAGEGSGALLSGGAIAPSPGGLPVVERRGTAGPAATRRFRNRGPAAAASAPRPSSRRIVPAGWPGR